MSRVTAALRCTGAAIGRPAEDTNMAAADPRAPTADEVLARLKAGNERFLRGEARFPTVQKEVLANLAQAQHPYATVLGCSDSRVPPELIFDAGFGELFVIRVAGNVISPEIAGSLQYAGVHLKTPLFVVLGHEKCGAVSAALAARRGASREPSRIAQLLDTIVPGLRDVPEGLSDEEELARGVDANVRWSIHQILESPEGQRRLEEGRVKIVGAVYEIQNGRVRFLD
jgi:carbonic anhydrase